MPEVFEIHRRRPSARGPRNEVDPSRSYSFFVEPERTRDGAVEDVATIFITNKECPFRCVFCDLWKNTTPYRVSSGAVARQVEEALRQLPFAANVKLYNSGNFFDEQAISPADRARIARVVADRRTVIVECHPRLVDGRCFEFAGALAPELEVAMGLETVDLTVLPRLNKGMTLDDFAKATTSLLDHGIAVRAFILMPAPYQTLAQGIEWATRSIEYAFAIGVDCCSIVPLRTDSGPSATLAALEAVQEQGSSLGRGRVFTDLWDAERLRDCPLCAVQRVARLRHMNLTQRIPPPIVCECTPP
jgi:uncharacterized Fe-S cluster-containing MiaB family protein